MIVIPFQINKSEYSILIALEEENLTRMKKYDPAELSVDKLPSDMRKLKLKTIHLCYATAEDAGQMLLFVKQGEIGKALSHLARGFEFRPDLGDSDAPYVKVNIKNEEA